MRKFRMLGVTSCLPAFAGFEAPKTYAAWPVWSESTTKEVKFQPLPKKAATRLWHRARDFDRQTRRPDRHGGALGHAALQVGLDPTVMSPGAISIRSGRKRLAQNVSR